MTLTLFFRLIVMSIFQTDVTYKKTMYFNSGYDYYPMNYNTQFFRVPFIICNDGWGVSLQIHKGNYCSTENGYRSFGHTYQEVEFGFPMEDEQLLHEYTECYGCPEYDDDGNEIPNTAFTSVGKVGRIPVSVMEEIITKHGGVDWEKTISIGAFNAFTDPNRIH